MTSDTKLTLPKLAACMGMDLLTVPRSIGRVVYTHYSALVTMLVVADIARRYLSDMQHVTDTYRKRLYVQVIRVRGSGGEAVHVQDYGVHDIC